ncbi:MAG TPA: M28 family metallopeptidase [Terriglobales bacterium]|nr:M28 family metallopeptidase [Terriglobales bacterium]
MKIRLLTALAFVVVILAACAAAQQFSPADRAAAEAAMKQVRPQGIRARMRFLTDDLLEGRGTGTRGYEIAARYVASEMEAMGLEPAGINGTWFQPVKFRGAKLVSDQSSFTLVRDGKEQALKEGVDYETSGMVTSADATVDAPVVFVGYGVTAPERHYDDYAQVDTKGKIIVTLYGAPASFPSTERAYYSNGIVKAANAVAHGAVGMVSIMSPEDARRYPWAWIVPQIRSGSLRWLDEKGNPHDVFPQLRGGGLLSQSGAEALFAGAPETLDEVFAAAKAGQPQGFPLAVSAKIHTVSQQATVESPNILGVLRGSDPKLRNQYVVYTAHVDHLGRCQPVDGDDICHGAFDNASGVAALLEVARAFTSLPHPPRRSVLFAFVTGEEKGLLGSDYFANNPTVPRGDIVANVNIDSAPGLLYPLKDVVPLGIEHSSLSADVQQAARLMGYQISPDPMPEEVFFIRSDQYSFVRQGIPAVDVTDGLQSSDPRLNGEKIIKTWMTTLYHTPKDNMNQPFYYDSAAKCARLNFLIGYDVAQQAQRPEWNRGDFFARKFAHQPGSRAGK